MAAWLAAAGGLAIAVFELDRGHLSNRFARLGLAPLESSLSTVGASSASGWVRRWDGEPRKRTERVSASFGNNPPERDPSHWQSLTEGGYLLTLTEAKR